MAEYSKKKFYWLKLQDDFFDDIKIKKLRKIAGGDTYTLIYLKMQLKSLKNNGILVYEGVDPTFEEELALLLDEDVDNVKMTLAFLTANGLIKESEDKQYLMTTIKVGSETDSAERVRQFREKQKQEKLLEKLLCEQPQIVQLQGTNILGNGQNSPENEKTLHCNANVTKCNGDVTKCNVEIEKDIEIEIDKREEKDIDIDIEKDTSLSLKEIKERDKEKKEKDSLSLSHSSTKKNIESENKEYNIDYKEREEILNNLKSERFRNKLKEYLQVKDRKDGFMTATELQDFIADLREKTKTERIDENGQKVIGGGIDNAMGIIDGLIEELNKQDDTSSLFGELASSMCKNTDSDNITPIFDIETPNTAESQTAEMQKFISDYGIIVNGYNGNIYEIDWRKVRQAYEESEYLRNNKQSKFLRWICKNYRDIVGGYYEDSEERKEDRENAEGAKRFLEQCKKFDEEKRQREEEQRQLERAERDYFDDNNDYGEEVHNDDDDDYPSSKFT